MAKPTVKLTVKPALISAVVATIMVLAIAETIALADTTNFPPVAPAKPVPLKYQYDFYFTPASIGQLNPSPGIYETRPGEIMVKVPAQTGDKSVIHNSAPSPIPVLHPQLKVVPAAPAGK